MVKDINVTLPDGTIKEVEQGVTPKEIAHGIAKSLGKKGLAAKWNGELIDYSRSLEKDGFLEIVTPDHEDALSVLRHSTAHLMAQAVKRLYPDVKFGVGPAIENGFYYDTDTSDPITDEDLGKIETEMMSIVKEKSSDRKKRNQ